MPAVACVQKIAITARKPPHPMRRLKNIDSYPLINSSLVHGKRLPLARVVTAWSPADVARVNVISQHLSDAVRTIKAEFPRPRRFAYRWALMDEPQARTLKEAGVGWINHNLNTSRRFYPEICSTHTYDDRVETVQNVKRAGLSTCSGGIIGMGETDDDILDLAYATRAARD